MGHIIKAEQSTGGSVKNDLQINFEIVVKMPVDIDILVWAFWYQHKVLFKPLKRISKIGTIKFLKDQMSQFGCNSESLISSDADDMTDDLRDRYIKRIDEVFKRR